MTLHSLHRSLKRFDLGVAVLMSIYATKEDVVNLNRSQLWKGITSDGRDIRPPYAPFTVLMKDQKGQPTDRVTLKDTGAFYDSIQVDVSSDSFTIDASDYKTDKLTDKYGKNIFGLTRISRAQYIEYSFFPALRSNIERKLLIKFG